MNDGWSAGEGGGNGELLTFCYEGHKLKVDLSFRDTGMWDYLNKEMREFGVRGG